MEVDCASCFVEYAVFHCAAKFVLNKLLQLGISARNNFDLAFGVHVLLDLVLRWRY